jgi:FMN phosphatase YigB (HAD superfamily)
MLISFDFDGTLSEPAVQEWYQKTHSYRNEYQILTARNEANHDQSDIYKVAKDLNINRVYFTNGDYKNEFFVATKQHRLTLHLDDCPDQIESIATDVRLPRVIPLLWVDSFGFPWKHWDKLAERIICLNF